VAMDFKELNDGKLRGGDLADDVKLDPVPVPAYQDTKPRVWFWQKHGFKRLAGGVLMAAAAVVQVAVPEATLLAQCLFYFGTPLFGTGVLHWLVKKEQGVDMTTDNLIREILELIIKLIKSIKKEK
jgi:hypothetical protein